MGKPFVSELSVLSATYEWAMTRDVNNLSAGIATILSRELITVGSGGSSTTAHLMMDLHEAIPGMFAKWVTALEFQMLPNIRGKAVSMFTAGGSNPDVLGALAVPIRRDVS